MVDAKYAATIAGIILFMTSLGVNVAQWKEQGYEPYSCQATQTDLFCHKLSKANAQGISTYCYYNKELPTKYKSCSSGWEKIEEPATAEVLQEEPSQECKPLVLSYENNCDTGQLIKRYCEGVGPGMKCKTTEDILSEIG